MLHNINTILIHNTYLVSINFDEYTNSYGLNY